MSGIAGNINRLVPGLIEKLDIASPEKALGQPKADSQFFGPFLKYD